MDMDKISWATVAVSAALSAGVSGLVTLVADLFARPGLEARKERILERFRAKREFRGLLGRIVVSAQMVMGTPPNSMTPDHREIFFAEVRTQREFIVTASRELQDRSVDFLPQESPRIRRVAGVVVGRIRGVGLSDKPNVQAGVEIAVAAGPLMDLLSTSRRHYFRRRSYLRSVKKVIGAQVIADAE